jgi:hypothetical protein
LLPLILLSFALNLRTAATRAATPTHSVVVGVNVYDEGLLSPAEQDAEVEQLAKNGVKTIRTGLSSKSIYFITQAFRTQVIEAERKAFEPLVQRGRLAPLLYYNRSGTPTTVDPMGVFRCGALTDAGRMALSPMSN